MSVYLRRIDRWLWIAVAVLGGMGILAIASAAPRLLPQQFIWMLLGVGAALLLCLVDLRPLTHHRTIIITLYATMVALLIATYFFAPVIRGSRSWLSIGGIQFQTSEFAKVILVITLAYFFARRHVGIAYLTNIILPSLYAAIPIGLILAQPDMGSALILMGITIGYFFVSGIRIRHIVIGGAIVAVLGVWGWSAILKPYQKERIVGLFYPERDPLGINYNVIQSKIAIGSGGWFGKGFQQGTQVQLGFLPEAHNDFVIATIIEEWGIIGGLLTLGALAVLLARIWIVGLRATHNFSRLLCLGTMMMFLLHIALNLGSATGILPVIGVSLPFVSYGGSNLLMNFVMVGIIQSIALREQF